MRKNRIKVGTNIIAFANARKAAKLTPNDWHDMRIDMANINDKTDVYSTNVDLIGFRVHTKTSLTDSL